MISWSDLEGRRVGLWGFGTEGRASLAKLRSIGTEPIIVDDSPDRISDETALDTNGEGIEALLGCDVVIKTPGISRRRPEVDQLTAAGVPVTGGLGLWLQEADPSRVLCITGTKGKSTTTMIAAHLAEGLGQRVFAGGNLGLVPYALDAPTDVDLWVIETSSYQATDLSCTPPVTAVTSLYPDHLPWHGSPEAYYNDKLSMCSRPGADLTVASGLSPLLVEREHLLGPRVEWVDETTWPGDWVEPLKLLGSHNIANAAVARSCLVAMGVPGADDDDAVRKAAAGFTSLESRLQLVGTVDGVEFVDDNLSTNVLPTIAAIDSFPGRRVALIAGGFDRNIDYTPLAEALAKREGSTLVLTVYSTGPKIGRAIKENQGPTTEVIACDDLDHAVRQGFQWAKPGGVVLLSPAAASFDAFDDYRHRGRVFRQAMGSLL